MGQMTEKSNQREIVASQNGNQGQRALFAHGIQGSERCELQLVNQNEQKPEETVVYRDLSRVELAK